MRYLVACIVMLVVLAGCGAQIPLATPGAMTRTNATGNTDVIRYVDIEAGVVCWIVRSGYGGGISCLAIEQTRLAMP